MTSRGGPLAIRQPRAWKETEKNMKKIVSILLLAAGTLPAVTIIGDVGAGPAIGYAVGNRRVSQIFTVPAVDNVLTEWQFQAAAFVPNRGFTTNISLLIYDWNGTITPSVPHFSTSVAWPASTGLVTFTGLNIPLVSGQAYVALYDTGDYRDQTIGFYANDPYAGGYGAFANDIAGLNAFAGRNFDTVFSATFVQGPSGVPANPPSSVPEPTTVSLLLGGASLVAIRRRYQWVRDPSGR